MINLDAKSDLDSFFSDLSSRRLPMDPTTQLRSGTSFLERREGCGSGRTGEIEAADEMDFNVTKSTNCGVMGEFFTCSLTEDDVDGSEIMEDEGEDEEETRGGFRAYGDVTIGATEDMSSPNSGRVETI